MKKGFSVVVYDLYVASLLAMWGTLLFTVLIWTPFNNKTKMEWATLMVAVALIGAVGGLCSLLLMLLQWTTKWPKTVNWFDIGSGILGLGWAIWLTANILYPYYAHEHLLRIFSLLATVTAVGGMMSAYAFRNDPHKQTVSK